MMVLAFLQVGMTARIQICSAQNPGGDQHEEPGKSNETAYFLKAKHLLTKRSRKDLDVEIDELPYN